MVIIRIKSNILTEPDIIQKVIHVIKMQIGPIEATLEIEATQVIEVIQQIDQVREILIILDHQVAGVVHTDHQEAEVVHQDH